MAIPPWRCSVLYQGKNDRQKSVAAGNRWNIDTGAGIPQLNRLSILELRPELRSWTVDVDETRMCQTAQVKEEERHSP